AAEDVGRKFLNIVLSCVQTRSGRTEPSTGLPGPRRSSATLLTFQGGTLLQASYANTVSGGFLASFDETTLHYPGDSGAERKPVDPAPPVPSAPPGWAGGSVAHYRILEQIGSGGMGLVF